jgi:hypothetical protein
MRELDDYLTEANHTLLHPLGWHIKHPLENGCRFLEIEKLVHPDDL